MLYTPPRNNHHCYGGREPPNGPARSRGRALGSEPSASGPDRLGAVGPGSFDYQVVRLVAKELSVRLVGIEDLALVIH